MINQNTKNIRKYVFALIICVTPFSFAAPVVNINDEGLLHNVKLQYEYYFKDHNSSSYLYSFTDSESYSAAEQFQKLLNAKAISDAPEYKVNEVFQSAFKQLSVSTSQQLDFLLTAFASPIYQASPSLQLLISLYHSVVYGSATQATMQSDMNWEFEKNHILWFLANYPFYPIFKPHLKNFLDSTYANRGFPVLYNTNSHIFSALLSSENEDYLEDLGKEFLMAFLWSLSCDNNSEEFRNTVSFMESCKLAKHSEYKDLKGVQNNGTYLLESKATSGPSKIRLTPVPDYFKDFSHQGNDAEKYSKKSLHHIMSKVVNDKTEGALFFVLYRGASKYQFFTVGVYQGYLSLTYVVDDDDPTPVLSFLFPVKGIKLDQLIDGIHSQLHQSKSDRDMVPDLQGIWMMSSQ